MCTAISLNGKKHLFGRNLDLHLSYGEEIVVMPRAFPFELKRGGKINTPYAVIGMAKVAENGGVETPLFYDGVNERGLAAAGLNFPYNAYYIPMSEEGNGKRIAPFELIPWVLRQCGNIRQARELLDGTVIEDVPFRADMPNTPLHWMLSDKSGDIVVEQTVRGICVYDNPVGVLTNNPPFEYQLENLKKYEFLRTDNPRASDYKMRRNGEAGGVNEKMESVDGYSVFSNGLGAAGLPGDYSSESRFVRADFVRKNSSAEAQGEEVGQLFHLLSSVAVPKGACKNNEGKEHYTLYGCCMDTEQGVYYYTTYGNRRISCVDMRGCGLDKDALYRFKLSEAEDIYRQN